MMLVLLMNWEQGRKILKVTMTMTLLMLICEAVFTIPSVTEWFCGIIEDANGLWVYGAIWLIMFLQVTILNIPAYVILSVSVGVGIKILSIEYILVVLSAYMIGCICAYWIGRLFGKKAVQWCAGSEEDYAKWCKILNEKGKWWYMASVVFPLFPDDLLCLICGAVKFNQVFYIMANLVGRGVGLVTMCLTLQFIKGSEFPYMLILWAIAMLIEIVLYLIAKRRSANGCL